MERDRERWREIRIPLDPNNVPGPFAVGRAEILALREGRGVAEITEVDDAEVGWLDEFDMVYFEEMGEGGALRTLRKAADEDLKRYRVPVWIQSEEVPTCCGRDMVFVGQLDDDTLCTERPAGARLWWHDAASFYVFTCSQCLSVEAVGQQF